MAKADVIISGTDAVVTFNGVPMADVNTIALAVDSERDEINLSTLDNDAYEVGLLGDLITVENITVNKKFDPAAELAMTQDNKLLVIAYKIGDSTAKTLTFWAQVADTPPSTVERSPGDGVNIDVLFAITNLNDSLAETGPAIATPGA